MALTSAAGRRTRRRLRIGAAFAVMALAACADETAPTANATEAGKSAAALNVRVDALGGVRADQARLLAVLIRQNMGAVPAHEIVGAFDAAPLSAGASARTYVVVVLDLKDAGGVRLHRIIDDATIDRPGGALAQADIARLADRLSTKLAGWRAAAPTNFALDMTIDDMTIDDMTTGGIRHETHESAASSKLRFDIVMGPAPGDGSEALSGALASALARRAPSADWGCGCYRLKGEVALASAEGGRVSVSIDWLVADDDGRPIGKVTQAKVIDPASIAGRWGEIAEEAAETAADGVLAVVLPKGHKGASGA